MRHAAPPLGIHYLAAPGAFQVHFCNDSMLFMIVEHFRGGDPRPVYDRFRLRGRLAPDGLSYVSSWVTTDLSRCYQVMECEDRRLLDQWIAAWSDLVEFDVLPVITSADAAARVPSGRLS